MITLTTPNAQKIYIENSTIEVNNLYCRVGFNSPIDGKTIIVFLGVYENEAAYLLDELNVLSLTGVEGLEAVIQGKVCDLSNGDEPITHKDQTLTVAHDLIKVAADSLGYLATISGI